MDSGPFTIAENALTALLLAGKVITISESPKRTPMCDDELLTAARRAANVAHCPYSHFRVGAAVLLDGRVFTGCNIENGSYALTMCAERVAIFSAVAAGCKSMSAIAVACVDALPNNGLSHRMPCGACLQVMAEFGGDDMRILVDGAGIYELADLLPNPFRL